MKEWSVSGEEKQAGNVYVFAFCLGFSEFVTSVTKRMENGAVVNNCLASRI